MAGTHLRPWHGALDVDWWLDPSRPGNHRSQNVRTATRRRANEKATMASRHRASWVNMICKAYTVTVSRFRGSEASCKPSLALSGFTQSHGISLSRLALPLLPGSCTAVSALESSRLCPPGMTLNMAGSPLCCSPTILFLALSFVGLTRRASCAPGWLIHRGN